MQSPYNQPDVINYSYKDVTGMQNKNFMKKGTIRPEQDVYRLSVPSGIESVERVVLGRTLL